MKPTPLLLASLLLAGCAHQPRQPTPPTALEIAKVPEPPPGPVLKPTHLESSLPTSATVVTVDSWLDDYFGVCRSMEEKLHHAALAAHPEWAPQIEAMRRVSEENENVARAAFIYLQRTGTDGIFWSEGDWILNVLPCNCGQIHRIKSPGWEDRFRQLTQARIAFERISDKQFRDAYTVTVFDLRQSLRPKWKTQMERLKPGFLHFMREPNSDTAHH